MSLVINIPGKPPTEIILETPISPVSSPMFDASREAAGLVVQEEDVAKRLSRLGFVEVPDGEMSDEGSEASSPLSFHEEIEIRVEMTPAVTVKRSSRFWVREKKGKRWVEHDYHQILQQLRRL